MGPSGKTVVSARGKYQCPVPPAFPRERPLRAAGGWNLVGESPAESRVASSLFLQASRVAFSLEKRERERTGRLCSVCSSLPRRWGSVDGPGGRGEGVCSEPRARRRVGSEAAPTASRLCRALPGAPSPASGQAGSRSLCIAPNPCELNRTSPKDKTGQIFPSGT